MTNGPQDPQRPDGVPVSLAGAVGCGLCATCTGSVPARSELAQPQHIERRQNRKAAPLDADHARIGELIRGYGSACAAFHFGPQVTGAYQACMAEIEKQLGVA